MAVAQAWLGGIGKYSLDPLRLNQYILAIPVPLSQYPIVRIHCSVLLMLQDSKKDLTFRQYAKKTSEIDNKKLPDSLRRQPL